MSPALALFIAVYGTALVGVILLILRIFRPKIDLLNIGKDRW